MSFVLNHTGQRNPQLILCPSQSPVLCTTALPEGRHEDGPIFHMTNGSHSQ